MAVGVIIKVFDFLKNKFDKVNINKKVCKQWGFIWSGYYQHRLFEPINRIRNKKHSDGNRQQCHMKVQTKQKSYQHKIPAVFPDS